MGLKDFTANETKQKTTVRLVNCSDYAITTSNAAHSPRNDKTVLPCLRHRYDILSCGANSRHVLTSCFLTESVPALSGRQSLLLHSVLKPLLKAPCSNRF